MCEANIFSLREFADIICVLEGPDPTSGTTGDDDLLCLGERGRIEQSGDCGGLFEQNSCGETIPCKCLRTLMAVTHCVEVPTGDITCVRLLGLSAAPDRSVAVRQPDHIPAAPGIDIAILLEKSICDIRLRPIYGRAKIITRPASRDATRHAFTRAACGCATTARSQQAAAAGQPGSEAAEGQRQAEYLRRSR